jgi:hypothetical protein
MYFLLFQSQEAWAAASGLRRPEKTPGRTPTRVETFLEPGKMTGPATRLAVHVLRCDSCSMANCPKLTADLCRLVVVAPMSQTERGWSDQPRCDGCGVSLPLRDESALRGHRHRPTQSMARAKLSGTYAFRFGKKKDSLCEPKTAESSPLPLRAAVPVPFAHASHEKQPHAAFPLRTWSVCSVR